MKKLNIQWFIEQHSDWEKILQEKPYCLSITRDSMFGHNLIMFKYNQIESDFSVELVRECRGLILDEDTIEPVCVPFFKFGNYGEPYCPEIDWKNCWVGEKLDGSLSKIVRLGDNLLISTNGTIDAFKAPIAEQIGCTAKSFGDLTSEAIVNAFYDKLGFYDCGFELSNDVIKNHCFEFFKSLLDEGKTYMFELTSPFNKVVVTWHETRLNFLGVRDNSTFQETYFCDHELKNYFNTPKVFPMRNIDECIKAAEQLDCNNEGYVVCDKNFNRVKVKSPTYVSLHHMKNNGVLSYERGVEIVRGNELVEVLTYFPEFREHLEKIRDDYDDLAVKLNDLASSLANWLQANGYEYDSRHLVESGGEKRKDAALFITKEFGKHSGFGFALLDKKVDGVRQWLENMPSKNIVKILGYKNEE